MLNHIVREILEVIDVELRERGRVQWEARAERVGPQTLALVREVFDEDLAVSNLRRVQAIVTLLSDAPPVRAEAAAAAARRASRTYGELRRQLQATSPQLDMHNVRS